MLTDIGICGLFVGGDKCGLLEDGEMCGLLVGGELIICLGMDTPSKVGSCISIKKL